MTAGKVVSRRRRHAAATASISWEARVQAAADEVARSTPAEINVATAETWAARAVAYRRQAAAMAAGEDSCEAWRKYDEARHEALEHAGTADDGGATLKRVEKLIDGTTTWRLNGVKVRRR